MKICLYQGTFNPIHNAHIEVAKYVKEHFDFEKITFVPAFKPPHKASEDYTADNAIHRLNMIQLAIEEYPYFDVTAIEFLRNKPSYTYDTIVQIKEIAGCEERINIIIGTDAFEKIESWYKADELKELVNFILFYRTNNFDNKLFETLKAKGYNYDLMQLPFMDISSTMVRDRIKQNKEIYDIVPLRVAEYIKQNNVY
ncbi:nicotinate (nicotinamide) nucleotide adenylyltransferase [bacterium]|nr:nicotinate (nicotinamide) nucleotide adenylyltransferase [bacterium]